MESGAAVETFPPSKAEIESRQDALQTTFSDKNRMRRSAAGGVGAGGEPAVIVPTTLNK